MCNKQLYSKLQSMGKLNLSFYGNVYLLFRNISLLYMQFDVNLIYINFIKFDKFGYY